MIDAYVASAPEVVAVTGAAPDRPNDTDALPDPTVIKSGSAPFEARDTEESAALRTRRGLVTALLDADNDGEADGWGADGVVPVLDGAVEDSVVDGVVAGVVGDGEGVVDGAVGPVVPSARTLLSASAPAPLEAPAWDGDAGTNVVSIGCIEPSEAL